MVDSVNLYASNLYGEIQNREVKKSANIAEIQHIKAKEFHKLVESSFNNYSKLSAPEILAKINRVRSTSSADDGVNFSFSASVKSELRNVREALKSQENEARKASIGKANLVDLLRTTTQAENYLSVMTAMRDELKGAWDKIWGMTL